MTYLPDDDSPGSQAAATLPASLSERVKSRGRELGFDHVGICPAVPGPHAEFLDAWLGRGYAADMGYMGRDPERRKDPGKVVPGARSVIVCASSYYPGDAPEETDRLRRGFVARYARGQDYHDVLKSKLLALLEFVRAEAGEPVEGRAYVDTGPVLEREAAAAAGVGQFGKNTMLIHRKLGSYLFLGVLIVTAELECDLPLREDICGRCTRCLDACPTGALRGPFELDARRCISYLTIEHRGPLPRDLRPGMGRHVFGCDICQEVCPWNRRAQPASLPELAPNPEWERLPLGDLLALTREEFARRFRGSPIKRARLAGLRRNAAVALGNTRDPEAAPALARALSDDDPLLRQHAAWALGQIASKETLASLRAAALSEENPDVREEIEAALRDASRGRCGSGI